MNRQFNPGRFGFAAFTAAATLALILVGGLVTSHGVGMSVPDWPNTYGYNMFFFPISQWAGGIFYEHSHRLVASAVGLLTVILCLWLQGRNARRWLRFGGLVVAAAGLVVLGVWRSRWPDASVLLAVGVLGFFAGLKWPDCEPAPRWLRRLGWVAVVAVILQGVLGGLRVTQIKDELGIFHAALAQLFFVLTCALALFTSPWWSRRAAEGFDSPGFKSVAAPNRLYLFAVLLIFAQLVLGATMRHQHAGLAIPDFPAAYGRLWPKTDPASVDNYNQRRLEVLAVKPITAGQIHLQMAHRLLAVVVLAAVAACAWQTARRFGVKNLRSVWTLAWLGLILTQVLLGAATIWSGKAADIATAHVLVGALSLALGSLVCIVSIRSAFWSRNLQPAFSMDQRLAGSSFGAQPSAVK